MLHDPFRFGLSAIFQLIAATYSDTQPSGSASASFTMAQGGAAFGGPNFTPAGADSYLWRDGGGTVGTPWEVEVTVTGGAFTSGPIGTSNLGTTRTWTVTNTVAGTTNSCTATFVIRAAGGGPALATASITIAATINAATGGGGTPGGGTGGGGGIVP